MEKQISSPLTVSLFVNRWVKNETVDVSKICSYGDIHVLDIAQVSNDSAAMKSLKIDITKDQLKKALSQAMSPKGVDCKSFFTRRRWQLTSGNLLLAMGFGLFD